MQHSPKVGVVGSGYWGKNLVRNYSALGALACVCDINPATLGRFAEQYPGLKTTSDYNAMLADPEVDGVVIATPAETHYALARAALAAGKHVYVEKPLVLDESVGEKLIRQAAEKGLTLMVGHLLQYHPVFTKLRELVAAGEFGRINYIYSHRLNLGKIRREENILWSFAPHDISMILSLADESPEEVTAVGGYYLHEAIADVTTTHLSFPSGLKAHIFVSWLHPFKEQKLVVVGEKMMGVFDDTLPWGEKLQLYPHVINWSHGMPVPTKVEPRRVEVEQDEPLRAECQHFLHCMATGERPRTDGAEGLRVLNVLTRAQNSLDLHRASGVAAPPVAPALPVAPGPSAMPAAPAYSAHETAIIDAGAEIGAGSKIWHYTHVLGGSKIGKNVSIGQNASIGPDVSIGDGCKIQNNISVYKGVTLEEDVFCGPSMVFTNVYNPRAHIRRMSEARPTLVRRGATLGANCTIVCGVTIGRYAFVGAGALVNRDVPDHALVVGNPARQIGWVCQCGNRLAEVPCPDCGKSLADVDASKCEG